MRRSAVAMALVVQLIPVLGFGSERFVRTSGSQPVVRDTVTGLIWQGCEAGLSADSCETGTSEQRIWEDALAYCDSLEWAGVSDWYLPDAKELRSIVDNRRTDPAVDVAAFPATPSAYFWTSSSLARNGSRAWLVYFNDGYVNDCDKGDTYRVRCVRRGP